MGRTKAKREIKNQSESTHGLKGKLEAKFPQNNQRREQGLELRAREDGQAAL